MGKKTLMMIALSVVAVALLGIKIVPLLMPRSWRMKKLAKKAGLPPPKVPKKKTRRRDKKSGSKSSGSHEQVASKAPSPRPAPGIDISALDRKIVETRKIITGVDVLDTADAKSPFMKYVVEEKKEEEEKPSLHISVSGVLYDSEKPLAIINGEIYAVGEKVGNIMVVEEIAKEFVVLSEGGKRIKVFVGE